MRVLWLLVLFVALGAAACERIVGDEREPAGEPPLFGTWVVEDIDSRGVIDNARLEINFSADGRISGVAACNNFTGGYAYAEGVLSVSALAVTKKLCAPALMDMQVKMLSRLESVTHARYDETMALILTDGAGRLLLRRDSYARASDTAVAASGRGLQPDDDDTALVIAGTLDWNPEGPLPDDAVAVVRLEDVSRADAPANVLAEHTMTARGGPPLAFTLAVDDAPDDRARLGLRAQIVSDAGVLYTTDAHNEVPERRGRRRMEVRLVATSLASDADDTAPPQSLTAIYECDGEEFEIAFDENAALVTGGDGVLLTIDRMTLGSGPNASRAYSNGRMTFIREMDSGGEPRLLFGRGRRAPTPCQRAD